MTDLTLTRDTAVQRSAGASLLPLVGRILIAAIFVLSGISKISDPAGTIGYIQSAGLPFAQLAFAGAVAVELIGGLLLVAGYRVRLVAVALAAFTVVAAFAFHFQLSDQNQFIHFFKNLALAGGLLQVAAFGTGRD